MSDCQSYTISELTDRFMIRMGISKRKYFAQYLVIAEEVFEDIFQNTLWVIKSVWQPMKAGSPMNYIDIPKDCQRLLSVGVTDNCNLIQPLYYNNQINVVTKPTEKKCGCGCTSCGGLCESVNSTTYTTTLLFTIAGVPYYEKKWVKACPNGDILEYTSTPTKRYNSLAGDGGDYNVDFNDDYDIADPPFSDYTIAYIESQKKICKLETAPCGCPLETIENETLFFDSCGFYVNASCSCKKKRCKQFSPNINNNGYGEVKIGQCGTKIYYTPSVKWKQVTDKPIPDWLLVNYQSTGVTAGAETILPKYSRNLFYAALDNGRKEYNGSFSYNEKMAACYKLTDEKNKIIGYLNPIDLIELSQIQDITIRY